MLNAFLIGIGAITCLFVALLVIVSYTNYDNSEDFFLFSFFGFGVIVAKSEKLKSNLAKVRGSKNANRKLYVTAPIWFNKYVFNIGGVKK